jgi:hypothetical protein
MILYSITKYFINLKINKYNKYYTDNQLLNWIYKLANIKIYNNSIDSIY